MSRAVWINILETIEILNSKLRDFEQLKMRSIYFSCLEYKFVTNLENTGTLLESAIVYLILVDYNIIYFGVLDDLISDVAISLNP